MNYTYDVAVSSAHIRQLRIDYNKSARMKNLPTLGQADLAEKLGVTREHYCLIENGKSPISIERLVKICAFFNVSADYVLGFAENKYNISDGIVEARITEIEDKIEESRKKVIKKSSDSLKLSLAACRQEIADLSREIDTMFDMNDITERNKEN